MKDAALSRIGEDFPFGQKKPCDWLVSFSWDFDFFPFINTAKELRFLFIHLLFPVIIFLIFLSLIILHTVCRLGVLQLCSYLNPIPAIVFHFASFFPASTISSHLSI